MNHFYDPLVSQLQFMNKEGLLRDENLAMLIVSEDMTDLFHLIENYTPPTLEKWLTEDKS